MKRSLVLFMAAALLMTGNLWAEPRGGEGGAPQGGGNAASAADRAAFSGTMVRSSGGHAGGNGHTVVINMNRGTSGGHNRNFPSQQSAQGVQSSFNRQPSYGQLQWSQPAWSQTRVRSNVTIQNFQRPNVQNYSRPGVRAAVAVHHHPYTPGYVRKKLQKIGVTSEPALITAREEIIHTDRAHSIIPYPQVGPDHMRISAILVGPRHFSDDVVRNNMMMINSPEWRARLNQADRLETQRGRYYWHAGEDFNYCHYIDGSGYQWYGWYVGDQYYWTRYFSGRWWTYDSDYDRWCFWNNGFWWWQDPYHVGDLYCYDNAAYIPCNSANDQIIVTAPTDNNLQTTTSPDGSRMVKLDTQTGDAFLYDTANPPTFAPVYLASGVQSIQFSDTSNGRPLEIILKLNDGSYDMFDAQGNAYGPGAYDQDQSQNEPSNGATLPQEAPANPPAPPPSDASAPPNPSSM